MQDHGFIAHLLKNVLSLETLPLIDRAHRSLRKRADNTSYPRAFIVKMHYFHDWQDIIRKAAQLKSIIYNGERLLIFPDLPAAILKQRARFNKVKDLLSRSCRSPFRISVPSEVTGFTQRRGNILHRSGTGDRIHRAALR